MIVILGLLPLWLHAHPVGTVDAVDTVGAPVRNGADRMEVVLPLLEGKRVALVVNQTSLVAGKVHLLDTLQAAGVQVRRLFSPEHGIRGVADAGEAVGNDADARTGIPIVSLYGKNKKPQPGQLQEVDAVVFDLQDVGARFYTYISTLYYVMQACAEQRKELVVLDRPNPCDTIDGPVLDPAFKSFVGMLRIPVLHGCTVGELARMIAGEGWLHTSHPCRLTVVEVTGWKHGQPYSLPVKPSPNLPDDCAIAFYPSLCPFEGTDISVGRGTTFPFRLIGSPVLRSYSFCFTPLPLDGFDKSPLHKGVRCYGLDLRRATPPRGFSLAYVLEFYRQYRSMGKGKTFFARPRMFDLLLGTDRVRHAIEAGEGEEEIRATWQPDLQDYRTMRGRYVLY